MLTVNCKTYETAMEWFEDATACYDRPTREMLVDTLYEEMNQTGHTGDNYELIADAYFQQIMNAVESLTLIHEYVRDAKRIDRDRLLRNIRETLNDLENY